MNVQTDANRLLRVERLRRIRPRDTFTRASLLLLGLGFAAAWTFGGFHPSELLEERRLQNLERFISEARPYPLQGEPWQWGVAFEWARERMRDVGTEAAAATLAISIVAILLAGAGAVLLSLAAARTFAAAEVFVPDGRRPRALRLWFWRSVSGLTRALLVVLRSIPEYLWAFLLLGILGPTAWVAILALALHNTGILGRLDAETIENARLRSSAALRGSGASRMQIAAYALAPSLLPRFLLFFFYRWETCVREATVLGMLGMASLGFWIDDARTRGHYDSLFLWVGVGVALVLLGDLTSAFVRRSIRRAG